MSEVGAEANEHISQTDVHSEPSTSWPGFIEIEVGLDDLRQFLGEEAYTNLIEFMKAGVKERQRSLGGLPLRTFGH